MPAFYILPSWHLHGTGTFFVDNPFHSHFSKHFKATSTKRLAFLSHHPPSKTILMDAKNTKSSPRPAAGLSMETRLLGQLNIPGKIKHED